MKGFTKTCLITASLLSIISIQGVAANSSPPNVELLGNANGLVHIPEDDLFLYAPNMLPGSEVSRVLEISNQYEHEYELFMRAEKLTNKEEIDLFDKLNLKISYDGKEIYNGPASGEDGLKKDISLGVYKPKDLKNLTATVEFDENAGNEYKNKSAEVNWVFTANIPQDDTQKPTPEKPSNPSKPNKPNTGGGGTLPQTGDDDFLPYAALAGTSILLLLLLKKVKVDK